jgi:hypothetical protein
MLKSVETITAHAACSPGLLKSGCILNILHLCMRLFVKHGPDYSTRKLQQALNIKKAPHLTKMDDFHNSIENSSDLELSEDDMCRGWNHVTDFFGCSMR